MVLIYVCKKIMLEGKNVVDDVHEVLDKMKLFSEKIRNGSWKVTKNIYYHIYKLYVHYLYIHHREYLENH